MVDLAPQPAPLPFGGLTLVLVIAVAAFRRTTAARAARPAAMPAPPWLA